MSGTTSNGTYHTTNGQIISPDGTTFVARGVNVMEGNNPSAAVLQQDFPGINFVRLAVYNYESPNTLLAYVNDLTSHGIVVELEDHNNNAGGAGGSQGQIFTGQALTTELNWYSAVGAAFKSNPNVWFGTNNEPSSTNASGQNDPAALSRWQAQTVQAVRNAGNNNPVLIEANSWGPGGTNVGYDPAAYANLHNVIWDIHYYGWLSKYSTDQATVSSTLSGMISDSRQITSADGTMPVIIGEYGNSTTGSTIDANATQVITAVQQSGVGNAAWAWYPGSPGDGLNDGGNGLSAYGKQVAAGIAAAAAKVTFIQSANNTVVTGTTSAITDASGNKWTITSGGQVAVNGTADPKTASVKELAYVNGTVWQENTSNLWWGKTSPSASWSPGGGTSTSPLPVAKSATITLNVSEDASLGDAQYTVKVDGTQVGGVRTATTLHSSGNSDVVSLTGDWGGGTHAVQIQFINDAYGGTAATDRNLYVNSIALNGVTQSGTAAAIYSNATSSFTVGGTTASTAGPADTLSLQLSEDAYNGDAQFILAIDGKQISTPQSVTASHSAGTWQTITFAGSFGAGSHTVGIKFTNDAYGGSASTDRNLYVNGIDVNGQHYGTGVTAMLSNGTTTFNIATTH